MNPGPRRIENSNHSDFRVVRVLGGDVIDAVFDSLVDDFDLRVSCKLTRLSGSPESLSDVYLFNRAFCSMTSQAEGSHSMKMIFLACLHTDSPMVPAPAQMSSRIVFESTFSVSPICWLKRKYDSDSAVEQLGQVGVDLEEGVDRDLEGVVQERFLNGVSAEDEVRL